jgi:DNA-binding XRE family transcriptional regulator
MEVSHAAQNIENRRGFPTQAPYCLSYPLPKYIFIKDYPISPRNFGEKLRKARMDAGLRIRELAQILDVSEDTVINWEVRGVSPTLRNLEKVRVLVRRLGSGNRP